MNIDIPAGETYGFYITMAEQVTGQPQYMIYTNGIMEGSVFSENNDLQITEGRGVAYPFQGVFTPRIWNGTVHYSSAGSNDPEQSAPNNDDVNDDGTPDVDQNNVETTQSLATGKYFTVDSTVSNGVEVTNVSTHTETSLGGDPLFNHPHGIIKFNLVNLPLGATEVVRTYFHDVPSLSGYTYRKYDPYTDTWSTLPGVTFGTTTIDGNPVAFAELTLTDGRLGDADKMVDGKIEDPGGPALPDTDLDGMPDTWESTYGLDLASDDSGGDADSDGDGISNLDEFINGTDPFVNDNPAPTSTKVPVHSGLWLIPSVLTGLYLLRRRKGQSA